MSKCNKFDICEQCSNLEFDPFACEDCEDGELFEPMDRISDDDLQSDEMTYGEFITWYKKVA